jgi:hypothetical protein
MDTIGKFRFPDPTARQLVNKYTGGGGGIRIMPQKVPKPVFRIRILKFVGLLDPDPDLTIIQQK